MRSPPGVRSRPPGPAQPVFDPVADLQWQLQQAQADRDRLAREAQQAQAERDQAQADRDRLLQEEQAKRARQAAAQRRYREKHPEVGRRLNREWRARRRRQLSASKPPELPRAEQEAQNTDPELAARQQRRRERNAAYMREYRARRRQHPS